MSCSALGDTLFRSAWLQVLGDESPEQVLERNALASSDERELALFLQDAISRAVEQYHWPDRAAAREFLEEESPALLECLLRANQYGRTE